MAAILPREAVLVFRCGLWSQHGSCAAPSRSVSENAPSSLQSTHIVETVVLFSLWSQLSHLDLIKLQLDLSYLTLCLFGCLGLWKLCCCAPGAVAVLLLLLFSLQVWPMPCWLLFLQFMACTRPSTQSCSIPSLVHPDIYP